MRQHTSIATGNRILDALAKPEIDRLHPHLDMVVLPLHQVLLNPGDKIEFIYFPIRGVVSVVAPLQDGSVVEVNMIGSEGFVGLPAVLGTRDEPWEVVVQGAGNAFRLRADVFLDEFAHSSQLRTLVLQFAELFLEQLGQTAACNARHDLEARTARWLLTMRDRLETDRFPVTQEFLAMLLGVRRASVTLAAAELQRQGLIRYHRGVIEILDPAGLETASCECHRHLKDRVDAFLRA